jgi:cell division GTPase FtsZ|tara:strand:+ start:967 stop:2118 length:1152 start_codon:yes stop_codon:yes gene_type:complete
MNDLNLPTLDIEDLDIEEIEESQKDELIDDAGGSLTYGIVGSGQGGGRMAKAFYDLGYTKTVAFNLAESDLNFLDLPDRHKHHLKFEGSQGAGKNHEFSQKAFETRSQEIFNKFKEIFGNDIDRIMICVGVGGGTGGGSVMQLLKVAKKYFTYIGVDNPNERVGVIASLPTTGECASPVVANNSYNRMNDLCKAAEKKQFSPLVIVDNDKIKKLYPKLTVKQFWPTLNNTVAGLFHIFNLLSNKDSNYTAFDSADYNSIMKTSGCMIFGATTVKNVESETSLSAALKNNLEKTLLAGGFDLTTAQGAASVIVGGTVLYETVPGLMDNIEYGFDTLAALTGGAIIHRGIYEDPDREKLVAYTIVGGLKSPKKRIEELKKFLKLK